jgi:glutaredoxin
MENKVKITVFKWAGSFGPFKIKIPCGECALTRDVIEDTVKNELAGIPIDVDIREWLSEWWKPLVKGGWHAPIVLVDGRVISQGAALNRGLLVQAVIESYAKNSKIAGNHLFGKEGCPYCKKAKELLAEKGIDYEYHDVVKNPRDMYEMIARAMPLIPKKSPITVPQIWLDGKYVGGSDNLEKSLNT